MEILLAFLQDHKKIAKEMRLLAINSLKAKKELPFDFKD